MTSVPPPTTPAPPTVMTRLKDETADLHRDAETSRFQKALVKGEVGREAYAAWLGQMMLIHEALEAALHESTSVAIAAVNRPEYDRAADLAADVADLEAPAAPAPLPATTALLSRIAAADDLALLGMRYVLEGSNNGNRFIAMAIRKNLPEAPTRYLDPYGEAQRPRWAQFKADMDAIGFDPAQQDRLVAAAQEMFAAVGALSRELASRRMKAEE
jgi:heme oxygenase